MIVKLHQTHIRQQDGSIVLNNIGLQVAEGEFVYLIGKTGSGKSSLLKTLYGALPLEEGSGEVAGFSIFSRNSGYIVAAPPRGPLRGRPQRSANSLTKGLVPGR